MTALFIVLGYLVGSYIFSAIAYRLANTYREAYRNAIRAAFVWPVLLIALPLKWVWIKIAGE